MVEDGGWAQIDGLQDQNLPGQGRSTEWPCLMMTDESVFKGPATAMRASSPTSQSTKDSHKARDTLPWEFPILHDSCCERLYHS
jgi:hypothetical protein